MGAVGKVVWSVPAHKRFAVPEIAAGDGLTVTVVNVVHHPPSEPDDDAGARLDALVTTPVAAIMVATGVLLLDHMPPVAVLDRVAGCTHAHITSVPPMAEGAVFTFIVISSGAACRSGVGDG